jgi:hypothetical protein
MRHCRSLAIVLRCSVLMRRTWVPLTLMIDVSVATCRRAPANCRRFPGGRGAPNADKIPLWSGYRGGA